MDLGTTLDISPLAVARWRYVHADACSTLGRSPRRPVVAAAATLDRDHETDAQQRVDELDGFVIDTTRTTGQATRHPTSRIGTVTNECGSSSRRLL